MTVSPSNTRRSDADTEGVAGRRLQPPEPLKEGGEEIFSPFSKKRQYKSKKGAQIFPPFLRNIKKKNQEKLNMLESDLILKRKFKQKMAFFPFFVV